MIYSFPPSYQYFPSLLLLFLPVRELDSSCFTPLQTLTATCQANKTSEESYFQYVCGQIKKPCLVGYE